MSQEALLQFPCDFPIKIMGQYTETFADSILAIVQRHAPDGLASEPEYRPSSGGNYLSITCVVRASSQAQLDGLYRELSGHPMVKVVL